MQRLYNMPIKKTLSKSKTNRRKAEKQDIKLQSLYFNHRISFDTKGLISPSSDFYTSSST